VLSTKLTCDEMSDFSWLHAFFYFQLFFFLSTSNMEGCGSKWHTTVLEKERCGYSEGQAERFAN